MSSARSRYFIPEFEISRKMEEEEEGLGLKIHEQLLEQQGKKKEKETEKKQDKEQEKDQDEEKQQKEKQEQEKQEQEKQEQEKQEKQQGQEKGSKKKRRGLGEISALLGVNELEGERWLFRQWTNPSLLTSLLEYEQERKKNKGEDKKEGEEKEREEGEEEEKQKIDKDEEKIEGLGGGEVTEVEGQLGVCVVMLGLFGVVQTPSLKLESLVKVAGVLNGVLERSNRTYSADDFLPLFIFLVVESGVANLKSLVKFTEEWVGTSLNFGLSAYLFTQMEIAVNWLEMNTFDLD